MDIRKLRGGQYFHISPDNIVVITISVADMASFITSCNPTSDLSMGDTLISPLWPVMLQLVERDQDSVWTMVQCVIMSRSSGHWTRCQHMSLVSDTTRAGVIDGLWTSFFNKKLWLIDALGGWYYCRVGAESCVISWESLKAMPSYINTDLWLSPLQNNHLTDTSHRGICVVSVENNLGYRREKRLVREKRRGQCCYQFGQYCQSCRHQSRELRRLLTETDAFLTWYNLILHCFINSNDNGYTQPLWESVQRKIENKQSFLNCWIEMKRIYHLLLLFISL